MPLPYILYSALMRRIRPNDGAFTMSTRPLIIPSTVRRAFSGRSASQEMRRAKTDAYIHVDGTEMVRQLLYQLNKQETAMNVVVMSNIVMT